MRLVILIVLLAFPLLASANEVVQVAAYIAAAMNPGTWIAYVAYAVIVASSVYGADQARKAANAARDRQRQASNDAMRDRTITNISTSAPFRYVIGKARVGSDITAMFTNGDKDQYRWLVCVHAAHECDAALEYWVAGKALGPLDADGYVTSGDYFSTEQISTSETFTGTSFTLAHTPIEGTLRVRYEKSVSTSDGHEMKEVTASHTLDGLVVTVQTSRSYTVYYDWEEPHPTVRVLTHLGGATDPADPVLMAEFPSQWLSTAVLRGFCYSIVMLDLNQPEFQNGLVPIEVLLRGMKLHDPRDAAYPADTPVWSDNSALAILWYLQSDLCEVEQSDIPLADYIAAANVCAPITGCTYSQSGYTVTVSKVAHGRSVDEVVDMQVLTGTALDGYFIVTSVPDADHFTYTAFIWNGSGYTVDSQTTSGTCTLGGLYTCNGTITADQEPDRVLEQLAQSMAGGIVRTTWGCWAGAYTAPVMALAQEDIVGSFTTIGGTPEKELFNGVRGQYISPDNDYVPTDFTPFQNAAYVAADGMEKWAPVDFPFTDNVHRVHQLCRVQVEDQRAGFTISGQYSLKAFKVKPGQRVTFTSAFVGQSAKVYRLTDREFSADKGLMLTFKEDDATIYDKVDAATPEMTPNTNLPNPWAISAPASLTFKQNMLYPERAELNWPDVFNVYAHLFQIDYMGTQHSTWNKLSPIGGLSHAIDGLPPGVYQFRIRTFNPVLNIYSGYTRVQGEMLKQAVPDVSGLEIFGRGNSMIFGGKHCRLAWRKSSLWQAYDIGSETYGGNSGGRDYYFKDYMVKVYSTAGVLLRTEYVADESYIYTFEHNAEDNGGIAARDFVVKVWQRGKYGQLSEIPATISPSNPVSELPAVVVLEGIDTVTFTYDEPVDLDWAGIRIWMSTTSGFTPSAANLVYDGIDSAAAIGGIITNQTYYYRYAVKDEFGQGETSAEGSFITQLSNQSLVSADAYASISMSPYGANRDDGAGGCTGSGAVLSTVMFEIPKQAAAFKLSAVAFGIRTRSAFSYITFLWYQLQTRAIKGHRKLTGTISIDSAGVITGTGTSFLTELEAGSRLMLGNSTGFGSLAVTDGSSGWDFPKIGTITSDTSATLSGSTYRDTAFSFSGEAWAYEDCVGSPVVSLPYNEKSAGGFSGVFEERPHISFVREITQAECQALLDSGATHVMVMSSAAENVSGQSPSVSVYAIERNVVTASVELQ